MNKDESALKIEYVDHAAFKIIFKSLYGPLLAYITTFTHNHQEAKDIVQNSFIVVWDNRKSLLDRPSLKNYLFKTARNLYIDQHRKNRYKTKVFDELKQKALDDRLNETAELVSDRTAKLVLLIENLPPRCKQILLLSKIEGKKYKEIADILNISIKTVESQMRVAYKKIRDGFNQTSGQT